jgi:hypothetical protein
MNCPWCESDAPSDADFCDALTGRHLWAAQDDRDLKDLFAMQDEIVTKILSGARVKLRGGVGAYTYDEKYFTGTQGLECCYALYTRRA